MKPGAFKAPFITRKKIQAIADTFRGTYAIAGSLPVDMHSIIEFDLGLEILATAGMREVADVDALLLGDLKTILIDTTLYMDDRMQNRVRYSLAHEVGHLVLHSDLYRKIAHNSIEAWIEFYQRIPKEDYCWIEQHAYEFAGRLLVPPDVLKKQLSLNLDKAGESGFIDWDTSGEAALGYLAHAIAPYFGVSEQVIERRLRIEGFWPIS